MGPKWHLSNPRPAEAEEGDRVWTYAKEKQSC